jgi:hypothetical protein
MKTGMARRASFARARTVLSESTWRRSRHGSPSSAADRSPSFPPSFMAMSIRDVPAIPVGEEIERLFRDHEIKVALEQTTESFRRVELSTAGNLRRIVSEGWRRGWDSSAFAKAMAGSHRVSDAIRPKRALNSHARDGGWRRGWDPFPLMPRPSTIRAHCQSLETLEALET